MYHSALVKQLDLTFGRLIKERDSYKCVNPFCRRNCYYDRDLFSCSHFIGRGNFAVRWDWDNCDGLCGECHTAIEGHKDEWVGQFHYTEFKKLQLGEERYEALLIRAGKVPAYTNLELMEMLRGFRMQINKISSLQTY